MQIISKSKCTINKIFSLRLCGFARNDFTDVCIFLVIFSLIFISHSVDASSLHHEKYFQQYVKYQIDVKLDIEENVLNAKEELLYVNNSPDTLSEIFFHLYINKYRRNSLTYPNQTEDRGWIEIIKITENDSTHLDFEIDRTLMNMKLFEPISPGDSVNLYFDFKVKLPPASGRYGYQGLHYDVGNWFVTPVVYDRAGWHLHQHIDNEFYQEWGDFNVTIRVPQDFRVGATGNLQNADEVLPLLDSASPEWLRADHSDTVLIPWEYKAERVHDFAWTTDPTYELLQAEWDGITLNILVLDYNVESWQGVTEWGQKALQFLCENYGRYPYDQLTVADTYISAGGIEYPQIVMINDFINPDYEQGEFRAVVIHEMAHNWFYGLLANNQLEHEWLDEGFTSFAEIKAMEAIFGVEGNMDPGDRGWLFNNFGYHSNNRRDQAYSYLRLTKRDLLNDPIDLHADYLDSEGYVLQYSKMANVLFMLEYTIGDSLFNLGMLNYFDQWSFRHPYPADFIAVMENTSGRDLDWFFDQWLKTNRKLDYAVDDIETQDVLTDSGAEYSSTIGFKRIEKIFMPVNFTVFFEDSSEQKYHIPVNNFSPYPGRINLPYWHFTKNQHFAEIRHISPIDYVAIDPEGKLLDINRLNNNSGFLPPMEWHFMRSQGTKPPLQKYIWEFWPLAFYNDIDKLQMGINLQGSYLNTDHNIHFNFWYKTATSRVNFDFDYATPISWLGKLSDFETRLFTLDGRQGGHIGIVHQLPRRGRPDISFRLGLANHLMFDDEYLMNIWGKGHVNTAYFGWDYATNYRGWNPRDNLSLFFQTSILGSKYSFSQIYLSGSHKFWNTYSDFEFDVRLFAGYSENDVPPQFLFFLGGDNSWGEFQKIFYRSRGSLPWPWKRNGNLYKSGGPDIKGYSLYGFDPSIYGKNTLALNLDMKTGNPIDDILPYYLRLISPHVFMDVGYVWNDHRVQLKSFRSSAGVSLVWESSDLFEYVFNLKKIRIDFPVWLSNPPAGQSEFDFRWLIRFDFE
jgi:hypothetical protein